MKVVAFNGSPRPKGNTSIMIERVFRTLQAEGIETELVQVGGKNIRGCIACMKCAEKLNRRCAIETDIANECIGKMEAADGIILGTPTYFADVTSETKALIDRAGFVARMNGDMLRRKVGAAVVAVRRAGAVHAFDTINHFFLLGQMVIPGSIYWNLAVGREQGDVTADEEGMRTMGVLGENMAWLLKRVRAL
ncbi:MAG: flavodoxin family protein [Planctomycetota bacterium]|nr:flavodoxin family protein [Planctomycetota bacterium]